MGQRVDRLARTVTVVGLAVAAGSAVAALNWHRIWVAFAVKGADGNSVVANEALDTFQTWVLVCLASLVVAVAGLARTSLRRASAHEATTELSSVRS